MKPFANRRRCELDAIIRAEIIGRVMQPERVGEFFKYRFLVSLARGSDGQALPLVFVDHRQHAVRAAVVCAIHDEVAGPDLLPALRTTSHARSVIQPQATPFRLFLRYFEPLATPDALHTLVVDVPALMTE